MPVLADVYGLYYNKDLLAAAGYTEPPKTLAELTDMAVKLTTFNDDGSIKTLGFMPLLGYYENAESHWAPAADARLAQRRRHVRDRLVAGLDRDPRVAEGPRSTRSAATRSWPTSRPRSARSSRPTTTSRPARSP